MVHFYEINGSNSVGPGGSPEKAEGANATPKKPSVFMEAESNTAPEPDATLHLSTAKAPKAEITKFNDDGSYEKTYPDGEVKLYDSNGNHIGGKAGKGQEYAKSYGENGEYTVNWKNGETYHYDKDGVEQGGSFKNGITWKTAVRDDGYMVRKLSNGQYVDSNGKQVDSVAFVKCQVRFTAPEIKKSS